MTKQTHGIDLTKMDAATLRAIAADAANMAPTVEKAHVEKTRAAATALIEKAGLTVRDVFPNAKRTKAAAPKFRHPDDKSLTWSGRGRRPTWLVELTEKGGEPVAV